MTTKPYYVYSIRSQWRGRIETPVAIGAKFVNMLDALSGIDPIFSDWLITDFPNPSSGDAATDFLNMKIVPLGAARLRIAEIIGNNVVLNDAREPSPDEGYTAIAVGGELYSPREVHISLKAGGEDDGGVDLEFGSKRGPPDLTTVTYRLYKAVLLAINAIWRASWACAYAFRFGTISVPGVEIAPGVLATRIDSVARVPLDPTFPYSVFHIPWIAYLSAEHANGIALTRDILTERTPDGGLLMSATTDRLDPDNPEHVRRARIIAEVMIARFNASSGASRNAEAGQ
jgi:hypothetical protein